MKLPDFEITPHLESLALEVAGLLSRLPPLDSDAKFLHLRKKNRISSIHSSLAIEANSLSFRQVTDIINGKRVLGDAREVLEVRNAWSAYEKIGEYDPFAIESLLQAHALLANQLVRDCGKFRTMQVNVYRGFEMIHAGAKPHEIAPLMTQLFAWARGSNINAIIKSCIMHFAIEYIHPFEDGNGRIGRLWQTVVLHSWDRNFQWIPVETVVYQNQQGYYAALNLAGKQNSINVFIEYMLAILKFALANIVESRGHEAGTDTLTVKERVSVYVSVKEALLQLIGQNNSLTVKQMAACLSLSERTLYRHLKELKAEGRVMRMGSDKRGYWQIIEEVRNV